MDKQLIIITTKKELEKALSSILANMENSRTLDFEKDRISRFEACQIARISSPTLTKRIREGRYKVYGSKRKQYLLRSEFIKVLQNEEFKRDDI